MGSIINISSSSDWGITGPAWVTNLPFSGSGDYDFEPILSTNGTGSYRTGEITIDYGDFGTTVIPILQYADGGYINARIFILGLDEDEGQLVHYEIGANGTTLNDANSSCGSSVDFSGYVEVGIVPVDGTTLSVKAYAQGYTNMSKPFSPTLNNAIYWLSSATLYETGEDVIDASAVVVPTTYSGGTLSWDGTIDYTYVGEYFYIVFDYRNTLSCGGGAISVASNGSYYPINLTINYGTAIGVGSFAFTSSFALSLLATYNENLICEGTTSGTYKFTKSASTPNTLLAQFSNGEDAWSGTLSVTTICVSLTATAISDSSYASSSLACAARGGVPTLGRWHNGGSTYPIVGDTIYTASNGSATLNGANLYWYLNGYDYVYVIDTNGIVQSITACICSEVAIPVITATTFYVDLDSPSSVKLTATNNPTSWAIVSTLAYYTIDGGLRGGKISYTDEWGNAVVDTIGVNEITTVVASTVPVPAVTISYGTAVATLAGTYYKYGILIDNDGNITGGFDKEGYYTISVNATNCFGVSANATINIKVMAMPKLHQFSMDDEGKTSSVSACALTGCDTNFWFSSNLDETATGVDPLVNDTVYVDPYGEQYFNGGYLYYKTSLNNYLLIDGIGQVIAKSTC